MFLNFIQDLSHLRVEIHSIHPDEDPDGQTSVVLPFPVDSATSLDVTLNSFISGSDCIQGVSFDLFSFVSAYIFLQ